MALCYQAIRYTEIENQELDGTCREPMANQATKNHQPASSISTAYSHGVYVFSRLELRMGSEVVGPAGAGVYARGKVSRLIVNESAGRFIHRAAPCGSPAGIHGNNVGRARKR